MTRTLTVAAFSIVVAAPLQGWAQRDRGRGMADFGPSRLMLATQQSVQAELKLTDEQSQRVTELSEKQREIMRGLRDLSPQERRKRFEQAAKANDEALSEILSADQMGRLKEIVLQQRGLSALADPKVAASLKLTEEQTQRVQSIAEEFRRELREIMQSDDRRQAREKMRDLRAATDGKYMAVLTDEQKSQWKEMVGAPFRGEIRRGGPGGRPRDDGGPGRPRRLNRPAGDQTADESARQSASVAG